MLAYVYILKSLKNGQYYVGSTRDVKARVVQHNSGNVVSTKHKRPYNLVFHQEFPNIDVARKVELKIKSWKRKDYIERIVEDGKINYKGPWLSW